MNLEISTIDFYRHNIRTKICIKNKPLILLIISSLIWVFTQYYTHIHPIFTYSLFLATRKCHQLFRI
jgi:hypothetical protein